jgi:hypothetical protein
MRFKAFLQMFVVIAVFGRAGQAQINDNFNDNFLDPRIWNVLTPSPGTSFTVSKTNLSLLSPYLKQLYQWTNSDYRIC